MTSGSGGSGNSLGTGGGAGDAGAGSGGRGTGGAAPDGSGGAGTGGGIGAAGSGSAGNGGAGPGGAAGTACPGAQALAAMQCRSASECPHDGRFYYCTTDPAGVTSACATPFCATTPTHECTVDGDCPMDDLCITVPIRCCSSTSTSCHVSCRSPGVGCAAGDTCAPGTKGANDYGCAPVLCDAGYTCPAGFTCAVGAAGANVHGCQALPCSQTGCPANFVCNATATIGGCAPKSCSTDCDCDAGFCVERTCTTVLGTCASPPL